MPRRVIRKATTPDLTIPIGGGRATSSLAPADFGLSLIEAIINVKVIRKEPIADTVYEPDVGIATDGVIGITLFAAQGTTLAAEVTVIGQP